MSDNNNAQQRWKQVFALFEQWQGSSNNDREALVARLRTESPQQYASLVAMIQADKAADATGFLDRHAAVHLQRNNAHATWTGARFGSWILRKPIGYGGMGQVWLATRADTLYSGRAAVKLLHIANASPEADARFAREAEFLGRLAHPRIAQLHDAGVASDGTRYLVLEYVHGEPLNHACDTHNLTISERLRLFLQVCEAVAYAHHQQIVHRDLKPANILVTAQNHVKLLDFGIAKLIGDSERPSADFTRAGSQWFTPGYAAPEQIQHSAITTATDVYALGAVLFNLLCGAKPYANSNTLADAVRNLDQPARSMLTALENTDDSAANKRSINLSKLKQRLRGDLEVIVAKALKVNSVERYDTAQALAEDVRRYLNREPLRAQQDTWSYRAYKFIQRNRVQSIAATIAFVSLLLGSVVTLQWRSATLEAERAGKAITALAAIMSRLTPEASSINKAEITNLLHQSWTSTKRDFGNDPELQAKLAELLGPMLQSSGETAASLEALTLSREHLIAQERTRSHEYLKATLELGYVYNRRNDLTAAEQMFVDVVTTGNAMPNTRYVEPIYAQIQLAIFTQRRGDRVHAHQLLKQAAQITKERFGEYHPSYLLAMDELAQLDLMHNIGVSFDPM